MAFSTVDFFIEKEDGWTLIATNPTALIVTPSGTDEYHIAVVASGTPSEDLQGVILKDLHRREPFSTGAITGLVFVRVTHETHSQARHFGVIRDQ